VHYLQRGNEISCFCAIQLSNKGIAEARPSHQLKSSLCNILIPGRLSANAKKRPAHWRPLEMRKSVVVTAFCPADISIFAHHRRYRNYEERFVRFDNALFPQRPARLVSSHRAELEVEIRRSRVLFIVLKHAATPCRSDMNYQLSVGASVVSVQSREFASSGNTGYLPLTA
jgi:hypothetical protein